MGAAEASLASQLKVSLAGGGSEEESDLGALPGGGLLGTGESGPAEEFGSVIDGGTGWQGDQGQRLVRFREPEKGGRILHTKARKAEAEGG